MRSRTALLLTLLLAIGPAGCGHGPGKDPAVATARTGEAVPGGSPSSSASRNPATLLKFSQCMREHGLSWFPDPDANGHLNVRSPMGMNPHSMDAAQRACAAYAPDGGRADHRPTAQEMEQMRQLSKCMRANGIANFPDPNPQGGISIDGGKLGTGPGDPKFDQAQKACDRYGPHAAPGGQHVEAGGGR